MPLTMRPAQTDELAAVGDLCVRSYAAGGHLDPTDPYAEVLRDAQARAAQAQMLVAERDGRIVGTVTICPAGSDYAEIARPGESEFRFLAVDPSAWRSGVGEALVDECERLAIERGQTAHVICVVDRNVLGRRLYDRLGFTRIPERDWSPRPGVLLEAYTRPVPYTPGG